MKTSPRIHPNAIASISVCILIASYNFQSVHAQLPTADLARIAPRSAKAGDSVEVKLFGSNLGEVRELRFSHQGITGQPVLLPKNEFFPEPRMEGSRFTVTVASDVPPGIYEVRATGYFGLSTARPFVVASANSRELNCDGKNTSFEAAMPVEINSTINGEVPGRGIHWFRFSARAGQRILIEVLAERIDSRLDSQIAIFDSQGKELDRNRDTFGRDSFLELQPETDGEFYVALSDILYRGGSEHFYRLNIHTRPHIDFVWPPAGLPGSTGQYTLYGRNLQGGTINNNVQLNGHALEALPVQITLPDVAAIASGHFPGQPRQGIMPAFVLQHANANPVRIGYAAAPVTLESDAEANLKSLDHPIQIVTLPTEIAGRFDVGEQEDIYRFSGREGSTYSVDVIADRMQSPVDSYVAVHRVTKTADGTESLTLVGENDDMPGFFSVDGKDSINADTTDSALSFKVDSDGDYQVTVVNQFGDGGPGHLYRLAIREPTPDFQLIATTERPLPTNRTGYSVTPLLRRGAKWGIRILCPRQDNFEGDITITAEGLPPGVTAQPLVLHGTTDRGILILSADSSANSWAGNFQILGRCRANGVELIRTARFASLVWGHIFADSIRVRSRLTETIPLAVNAKETAPVIIEATAPAPLTVETGQELQVPIKIQNGTSRVGNLTIEPHSLFGLLRNPPKVNIAEQDTEGTLRINFTPNGNFKLEPGEYQFALHATGVTKYQRNTAAVTRLTSQLDHIRQLAEAIKTETAASAENAANAKASLDLAEQKLKATPAEQDQAALQQAVVEEQVALKAAVDKHQAHKERQQKAEQALAEITKALENAKKTSATKDTNFAAWSDLVTVTVLPKPE